METYFPKSFIFDKTYKYSWTGDEIAHETHIGSKLVQERHPVETAIMCATKPRQQTCERPEWSFLKLQNSKRFKTSSSDVIKGKN